MVPLLLALLVGYIIGYYSRVNHQDEETLTEDHKVLRKHEQFLVILVLSSLGNIERRSTIRETWAKDLDKDVQVFFVISNKGIDPQQSAFLSQENSVYNDLLIFNGIEDTFHSLTTKVLAALSWLSEETTQLGTEGNTTTIKPFSSFSFVLKTDDDSYVRVPDILLELRTKFFHNEMLYWGFFDGRAKVQKAGKYKELAWNICDNYLPYALGGGYVLGKEPVKFIARNGKYWRRYRSEDTSVGAWLANLNGVDRQHDPRFDTEYLSRGCHQSYLITHKHTTEALRKIDHYLKETGSLCPKEYRTRLSYQYDWHVQPSKCCLRDNPGIP